MKTKLLLNHLLLFILFASLLISCSGNKKVSYTKEKTEIKTPLSGSEYKTDNSYYRVVSQGISPDLSMAEKLAMSNARSKMALQIQTLVMTVTRNYAEQLTDSKSYDIGGSFQTLSEDVAKQVVPNMAVKENKVFKGEDNVYEYWVCIEVLKKDIVNTATNKLSSNKALRIETNRDNFQKIFDDVMSKQN